MSGTQSTKKPHIGWWLWLTPVIPLMFCGTAAIVMWASLMTSGDYLTALIAFSAIFVCAGAAFGCILKTVGARHG